MEEQDESKHLFSLCSSPEHLPNYFFLWQTSDAYSGIIIGGINSGA